MILEIIIILIGVAIYWLLKLTLGDLKEKNSSAKNGKFLLAAVTSSFVIYMLIGTDGIKKPGSIFERNKYEGHFYVISYSDNNVGYLLPAKISSFDDNSSTQDGIFGSDRKYKLEYVIMPNGSKKDFYISDDYLSLGEMTDFYDEDHKKWQFELTNKPVKH